MARPDMPIPSPSGRLVTLEVWGQRMREPPQQQAAQGANAHLGLCKATAPCPPWGFTHHYIYGKSFPNPYAHTEEIFN